MRGATLFSGIGAPECAAPHFEWRWSAEIDPFASAVHAARFPGTPNLGNVEGIDADAIEPVDLVVFGSPCQSFSVAGRRLGLDDPRGNLALVALRLIGRIRPRWFVFENVPGLLSSDGGRDFGAFLGTVEQCGYGWAYRTLDAQFAGVPQRRRRVFVVGYLGDWRPAAAVLFEPESLRGDTAPRREAGERIARTLTHGVDSGGKGGYAGRRREDDDNLIPAVADPISCSENRTYTHEGTTFRAHNLIAFGSANPNPLDVSTTLNARGGSHGRLDFESETFIAVADIRNGTAGDVAMSLQGGGMGEDRGLCPNAIPHVIAQAIPDPAYALSAGKQSDGGVFGSGRDSQDTFVVAHTLRADGFDAGEDGTGRGTPIIPVDMRQASRGAKITNNRAHGSGGAPGHGVGENGDPAFTVSERGQAVATPIVPVQCNGTNVGTDLPSLRAGNGHLTGGGPAVAYTLHGADKTVSTATRTDLAGSVRTKPPGSIENSSTTAVQHGMSVRRLLPVECEKLQGFPPGWTDITYRGKPAADGPRYRALGNSMAVPVIGWVLGRIREFEERAER